MDSNNLLVLAKEGRLVIASLEVVCDLVLPILL